MKLLAIAEANPVMEERKMGTMMQYRRPNFPMTWLPEILPAVADKMITRGMVATWKGLSDHSHLSFGMIIPSTVYSAPSVIWQTRQMRNRTMVPAPNPP